MNNLDQEALEAAKDAFRDARCLDCSTNDSIAEAITAYLQASGDGWEPIETAPKGGEHKPQGITKGPKLDVVVKTWNVKKDVFEYVIHRDLFYSYGSDGAGGWAFSSTCPFMPEKQGKPILWKLAPTLPTPPGGESQ